MGWLRSWRGHADGGNVAAAGAHGHVDTERRADAGRSATDRSATDRRLIRAITRHGSSEAADQLVRAYFDDVLAFVWRSTGDREHALDLTQETMIAALRALGSYDPAKASVRTWLYAIASHKVIDSRRSRRIVVSPLDDAIERNASMTDAVTGAGQGTGNARDPADVQADADLLARIEAYVARFDAGTQEIFQLRTAAGLTFPQIAAARGEREEAVKGRWYRLMGAIRKEFGDERTR